MGGTKGPGTRKREKFRLLSDGVPIVGEVHLLSGSRTLIVLCHGIPMSRPDPRDGGYPELACRLCDLGFSVVYFNMRGTGESWGNFSLKGWFRDIESVMDFIDSNLRALFENLVIVGFSAGAALAIKYAALHKNVDGVASFSAPARFSDVFGKEDIFAFIELAREIGIIRDLHYPPDPFDYYEEIKDLAPVDFIDRISPMPLLLVHGKDDDLIPVEHARILFEKAGEPRRLMLFDGGTHHLRRDRRSIEVLSAWVKDTFR